MVQSSDPSSGKKEPDNQILPRQLATASPADVSRSFIGSEVVYEAVKVQESQ